MSSSNYNAKELELELAIECQEYKGNGLILMQAKDIPIMSVDESIETDRGQRHIAQLHTVTKVLENRMFYFCWSEIEIKDQKCIARIA